MKYASPELVVLGTADVVVLGQPVFGANDHTGSITKPSMGLALGLDD